MTPFRRFFVLAALLSAGCASVKVTLRNNRDMPVKHVDVRAASHSYSLDELAPGAEDTRTFKADVDSPLGVNFVSADGGLYYTASKIPLQKGKSRKLILSITPKGDLVTEEEK